MSTGVFEVIAADQSQQVVAGRQAVSLATKRVNERFGSFLLGAATPDDLKTRLSYVEEDLDRLVVATCEETGYENGERLAKTIKESFLDGLLHGLGDAFHGIAQGVGQLGSGGVGGAVAPLVNSIMPGGGGAPSGGGGPEPLVNSITPTSSVHEARRPKMCPYHKEVVDISLAEGKAAAGFEAMAGHAFGPMHCDGEYEGNCNFRREMVTQSWWDDRDKALQERREERERERAEQAELEAQPTELETEVEPSDEEPSVSDSEAPVEETEVSLGEDSDLPSDGLTEAPEGVSGVEAEVPMAVAASFQRLAPGKHHLPGASDKQNRQYEHIKQQYIKDGLSEEEAAERAARTVNKQRSKKSEALETVDVTRRGGPSPKMDKRKWTPENLQQRVETEGAGSPHPTHEDDLLKPRHLENNDRQHPGNLSEIGEQVTERQDVSKDTHPTPTNKHTWPTGELTAVSSAPEDVTKNPLQEILNSDYDGFVPQVVVQAAVARR